MPAGQDGPPGAEPRASRSFRRIITGVLEADPAQVERAAIDLGQRRRLLAPLAFVAGTLALMIVGIKPIIKNWRLMLVELVPAAWVWVSMWNLKSHVLDQRGVHHVHFVWFIPATLLIIGIAILAFWCNALFVFAIGSSPPLLRPAVSKVNEHLGTVVGWGVAVGSMHAFVTLVLSQQSKFIYDLSLSIVVAVMMVTFVTVPASLAGITKRKAPPRERVASAAVGGTLAAVASTPGFVLDRIGLLMIGTKTLRIPGFLVLSLGVALQVAATSSTKAVRLSTKMVAGSTPPSPDDSPARQPSGG